MHYGAIYLYVYIYVHTHGTITKLKLKTDKSKTRKMLKTNHCSDWSNFKLLVKFHILSIINMWNIVTLLWTFTNSPVKNKFVQRWICQNKYITPASKWFSLTLVVWKLKKFAYYKMSPQIWSVCTKYFKLFLIIKYLHPLQIIEWALNFGYKPIKNT